MSTSTPTHVTEERRVHAWIGQGVVIEGTIKSAQDLRIDGKVEGTIHVGNHGVIVGASAEIDADLAARSIVISGTVRGNVIATEQIAITETASVHGNVTAPRLAIAAGAHVNGKVDVAGTRKSRESSGDGKSLADAAVVV